MNEHAPCSSPCAAGLLAALSMFLSALPCRGDDCNQNGIPDDQDLSSRFVPLMPLRIPAGPHPQPVAVTDLDSDGDVDLVVANSAREVVVFANRGGWSFEETLRLQLDLQPTALLAADLNGDASLDLAVTAVNIQAEHVEGALFVALNQGNGTFGKPGWLVPESGPRSLAALDLEGDGYLDLAVANRGSGTITLFRNEGGEGSLGKTASLPAGDLPESLQAADLDGNGLPDLVFLAGPASSRLVFLESRGDGTFAEAVRLYSSPATLGLGLADVDGDRRIDVALSLYQEDRIAVLRNLGGGKFAEPRTHPAGRAPLGLWPADLDGDGDEDLAVLLSESGLMGVLRNRGGGDFERSSTYYLGRLIYGDQLSFADLDRDGDSDLAAAVASTSSVTLVQNLGGGRLAAPLTSPREKGTYLSFLRTADLDGDEDLDMVFVHGERGPATERISVQRNDGPAGFINAVELEVRESIAGILLLDTDGDRDRDLLVAQRTGRRGIHVFPNRGDGTFAPAAVHIETGHMTFLETADFNGDAKPDLVLPIEFPAAVLVLVSAEDGTFLPPATISWRQEVFSPPVYMAAGDFTGDGLADVLVGPYHNLPAQLFVNQGNRRFARAALLRNVAFFIHVASADLDRDGDVDLATALGSSVSLYFNDGTGRFADGVSQAIVPNPISISVSDLDLDGAADLLVPSLGEVYPLRTEGVLQVFLNDGKGSFPTVRELYPGFGPEWLFAGDIDRDGSLDLVTGNLGDQGGSPPPSIAFLMGVTPPPSSQDRNGNAAPDECESLPFHRGDSNGDGALDVSDGLCLLEFLFSGSSPPPCKEAADANNDGAIDCSDPVFTLGYLFLGSEAPAVPGPPGRPCGPDLDLKGSPGFLGCEAYDPCA